MQEPRLVNTPDPPAICYNTEPARGHTCCCSASAWLLCMTLSAPCRISRISICSHSMHVCICSNTYFRPEALPCLALLC